MVTASVRDSADGVQGALEDRDVMGIAALAALGAGGVFVAQYVADMVLPMLDYSKDPTTQVGKGVSVLTKAAAATVMAMLAVRLGSTGAAAAGTMAFGVLVSMGLDMIEVAQQTGGMASSMVSGSSSASASPSRPSNSPKRVSRPKKTPSKPARAVPSGNESFR